MYYGGKDRGRDRSSDGSETPQLKEAGASQVRYVLRECEGGVKRDTQVTDTRRVCVGREFLSQQLKVKFGKLLSSPKPDQLSLCSI